MLCSRMIIKSSISMKLYMGRICHEIHLQNTLNWLLFRLR